MRDFPWLCLLVITRWYYLLLSEPVNENFGCPRIGYAAMPQIRCVALAVSLLERPSGWWFGTWNLLFHLLGMSSSQLTNIFQRGWNHQPVMIRGRTPGFYRPMSTAQAIPTEPPLPPPSLVQSIVAPGDRPEVVLKGAWYPERPGENDGF